MSQRGIDFLESWKLKYIDSARHLVPPEEIDKLAALSGLGQDRRH
jgi:hypothetical protein